MGNKSHGDEYRWNCNDIVPTKRPDNGEGREEKHEPEPEREEEPESGFFLLKTRNKSVKSFFSETIDDECENARKEEVSKYLEKEDKTTICTTGETEVDEAEDEEMEKGI